MVLSSSSPRSVSLSKKEKECLERETCFVFSLYELGKSIKKVRDLIKYYQIESISPVPYITMTGLSCVPGNVSAHPPSEIPHNSHSVQWSH
jgi:hypothetical protein